MYTLIDGAKRNKQYPQTFHIPSPAEIDMLVPGDNVKLGFEDKKEGIEKMWVEITKVGPDRFEGTLNNDPALIPDLSYGQLISFKRNHILSIYSEGILH